MINDKRGSRFVRAQFAHYADMKQLARTVPADRLFVDDILYCPQSKIAASKA